MSSTDHRGGPGSNQFETKPAVAPRDPSGAATATLPAPDLDPMGDERSQWHNVHDEWSPTDDDIDCYDAAGLNPYDAERWAMTHTEARRKKFDGHRGIPAGDVPEWVLLVGADNPDIARGFVGEDMGPADAEEWIARGFPTINDVIPWLDGGFTATEAETFAAHMSADEAAGWKHEGFDADDATAWADYGFPPRRARQWAAKDYAPAEAARHTDDGLHPTDGDLPTPEAYR